MLELTRVKGSLFPFSLDLTKVPERGSVSHEIRMEALRERNAEMEFYCWAGIALLMFLGFIFRRRY